MIKVTNYKLETAGGKHIRIATKVIFPEGREIKFMERLSRKEAIKQANSIVLREQMNILNGFFSN